MVQRNTNKLLQIVFNLKSRLTMIKERFQNSASDSEYKRPNLQYQDIILYSRTTLVLQIWKDSPCTDVTQIFNPAYGLQLRITITDYNYWLQLRITIMDYNYGLQLFLWHQFLEPSLV